MVGFEGACLTTTSSTSKYRFELFSRSKRNKGEETPPPPHTSTNWKGRGWPAALV